MPTRPTNMPTISTSCPQRLRLAVTPRSKPTVPKAETQVNSFSMKL